MDLHVEVQCVDQMKKGKLDKFLLLFDACFDPVYGFVARRRGEGQLAEEVVNFVFLDALGQVQSTPSDVGYLVWLYSLARPRVLDRLTDDAGGQTAVITDLKEDIKGDVLKKAENMIKRLGVEEREILRLKFFEEVSDGDVMVVLASEEGLIGPKIYRVLKEAHKLLFGESDERQGVYFGELSGFLARVRDLERIEVPQAFKLSLRSELRSRIERRDMAVELDDSGAVMVDDLADDAVEENRAATGNTDADAYAKKMPGSDDPAKIFVEAAKKMTKQDWVDLEKEQEAKAKIEEVKESLSSVGGGRPGVVDMESADEDVDIYTERYDFVERFRVWLFVVPVLVVFVLVGTFAWNLFSGLNFVEEEGLSRIVSGCEVEVEYESELKVPELVSINGGIANRICDHFEVEGMKISKSRGGYVYVAVDLEEVVLNYRFVMIKNEWRIKRFEKEYRGQKRALDSNQEPREV